MHRVDISAALIADRRTALLVDRRSRGILTAAQSGGLTVDSISAVDVQSAGMSFCAAVLRPLSWDLKGFDMDCFPRRIEADGNIYIRFLDRFYLPITPDPVVSRVLFDLIADAYDQMAEVETNIETARVLLEAALGDCVNRAVRVLDYGCGTGLALEALRRTQFCQNVDLIGTDLSDGMLMRAANRGESVVALQEWRVLPENLFDGGIAAFVLHFGVSREDCARIARQLRPGGRFAANYFKADQLSLNNVVATFNEAGMALERMGAMGTTPHSFNPMLVFLKGVD